MKKIKDKLVWMDGNIKVEVRYGQLNISYKDRTTVIVMNNQGHFTVWADEAKLVDTNRIRMLFAPREDLKP